jgi:hypothetical protein
VPDNDNDRYLQGRFEVEGRDFVDAGLVSSRIKKGLKARGTTRTSSGGSR